ncbi:MAG: hypothetical protein WC243_02770 [Patescibacteria group bacterium]|jgi:D-alanyl-D-alanine carboxypeptidase (penicillin-binding protein 5/6)
MTLSQKIKTFFVLQLLRLFRWMEFSDMAVKTILRTALVLALIITFFMGFYMESRESDFYRYVPGIATFISGSHKKFPVMVKEIPQPQISARAALVVDLGSDRNLFELNIHTRYPPASTTKLMTAIVSNDLYSLDEVLVTPEACSGVEGSRLGLIPGEEMIVGDLLTALLVSSANDAACVLGSGKTDAASFVTLMNDKALSLGLSDTFFDNSIGFDSPSNTHYSSAYDLYVLAKEAMTLDFIRETVKIGEVTLKTGVAPRKIYTTNLLLWSVPESYGIKTGKTLAAGEVLIYGYRKAEKDLIIVVMGSEERFMDTRQLLDWSLTSYMWQ